MVDAFKFKCGREARTLKEFHDHLQRIDDSTFRHHVNSEKNDFQAWVANVHRDAHLAGSLSQVFHQKHAANVVKSALDVKAEHSFRVSDGRELKNLRELRGAIASMNAGTYGWHANDTRNDFANWVGDVVGKKKLAHRMRKSQSQAEMVDILNSHF